MSSFARPIVVVSKCLGLAACRYDGQMIPCDFVESMKSFVDFIDVCPECEIELGVPRDSIRIVLDGEKKLVQPATGRELTQKMERFARSYLENLDDFDGFILKSRSPSCGILSTKIYPDAGSTTCLDKRGSGFFADIVTDKYSHLPAMEDEQLDDILLRDHFLIMIFTLASFREMSSSVSMRSLIEYHTCNKLLFMSYNKNILTRMGNVVANREGLPAEEVFALYLDLLTELLSEPPETGSTINAMMHAFGYLSRYLGAQDKFIFLQQLQQYREDVSVLLDLKEKLMSWALHFDVDYISNQTFFRPYPQELVLR